MKRPFPKRRTDTITRGNIFAALANAETVLETPADVADYILGRGGNGTRFAKPRHVARCHKLMQPKKESKPS